MRRDLLIGLAAAVITVLVYLPVRTHEFIFYDDPQFITENPQIQSGLSWNTIRYAFTTPVAGNWHPITTLSHAFDCELFGVDSGKQHLANVLIHAANAMLLFLLLQRWRLFEAARRPSNTHPARAISGSAGAPWLPPFIAAVFALHPLRVESVAWISERKDVLSGLFFLLTLWCYTRFAEGKAARRVLVENPPATSAESRSFRIYYALALASFALGLMSKPMLVTVPFVLLLLDLWPLGRLDLSTLKPHFFKAGGLVFEKAPFFALSAIDCWITVAVQRRAGAMEVIQRVSWSERLSNAVVSCLRYLGKLFWPADLAIVYPHPARHYFLTDRWPGWEVGLGTALLVLITVFVVLRLRSRPYLAVGWFWFLGMLVPVIGLVQVGEQAMADRYTYLPMIGPVIALAWWLDDTLRSFNQSRVQASWALATCAVAIVLACATEHQLGFWQNTVTLFDHAVGVTADNPSAQFALGVGLDHQGEIGKAMVRYRVAIAIDTNYSKAYYNMGQVLRKEGRWREAADAYLAAARANPADTATQLNLAGALARVRRPREAVAHFEEALRLEPNSVEGLNNLAWLLSTCPDPGVRDGARAVQLAERACALTDFKMPVALGTLAAAYAESGRFIEAVTSARNACSLATQTGDSTIVSKNQELLKLYAANKPYRDEPQRPENRK